MKFKTKTEIRLALLEKELVVYKAKFDSHKKLINRLRKDFVELQGKYDIIVEETKKQNNVTGDVNKLIQLEANKLSSHNILEKLNNDEYEGEEFDEEILSGSI